MIDENTDGTRGSPGGLELLESIGGLLGRNYEEEDKDEDIIGTTKQLTSTTMTPLLLSPSIQPKNLCA